jgi:hypothetical protein
VTSDRLGVEEEARSLCRCLLCDQRVSAAALRDPQLRLLVDERLDAVGFRVGLVDGVAWAVARADAFEDDEAGFSVAERAALALLAVELLVAPEPQAETRPRLTVTRFAELLGREQGWSKAWLRRAVLGRLERDGYIKVVAPGQRRSDEYVEAGPRLRLLDLRGLQRALEAVS